MAPAELNKHSEQVGSRAVPPPCEQYRRVWAFWNSSRIFERDSGFPSELSQSQKCSTEVED